MAKFSVGVESRPPVFFFNGGPGFLRTRVLGGVLRAWPLRSSYPLLQTPRLENIGEYPGGISGLIGLLYRPEKALEMAGGRPVIQCSNRLPVDERFWSVISDDRAVGALAGEHLWRKGYRRLVYLQGELGKVFDERWQGLMQFAGDHGMLVARHFLKFPRGASLTQWEQLQERREGFHEIASNWEFPVGLVTSNDTLAVVVMEFLQADFAEQLPLIALLGIDNDDQGLSLSTGMSISSVEPDFAGIGRRSAEVMHALFAGEEVPRSLTVPPLRVVERESTTVQAVSDVVVARAQLRINHYLDQGVSPGVGELAEDLRVSQRTLNRRFHDALDKGPKAFVLECKIGRALKLLRETPLSIAEIAFRCGFSAQSELSNSFKSAMGMTPRDFRGQLNASEKEGTPENGMR